MLLNDLYTIHNLHTVGDTSRITLRLNALHKIFQGHFPGQPVVPGACLLQIVEEMTAEITGKAWKLAIGDSCKFIEMIDPNVNGVLEMKMICRNGADEKLHVSASLSKLPPAISVDPAPGKNSPDGTAKNPACFKFTGTFQSA